MTAPHSLKEADDLLKSEKKKVRTSIEAIFGSRVLLAVMSAMTIAFGAHLIFAPMRLPTISGFSLAAVGLPPIDFGLAGQAAHDAADAAVRQGAGDYVSAFLDANPQLRLIINAIAFGACAVMVAWTMAIQIEVYRRTGKRFG